MVNNSRESTIANPSNVEVGQNVVLSKDGQVLQLAQLDQGNIFR